MEIFVAQWGTLAIILLLEKLFSIFQRVACLRTRAHSVLSTWCNGDPLQLAESIHVELYGARQKNCEFGTGWISSREGRGEMITLCRLAFGRWSSIIPELGVVAKRDFPGLIKSI